MRERGGEEGGGILKYLAPINHIRSKEGMVKGGGEESGCKTHRVGHDGTFRFERRLASHGVVKR